MTTTNTVPFQSQPPEANPPRVVSQDQRLFTGHSVDLYQAQSMMIHFGYINSQPPTTDYSPRVVPVNQNSFAGRAIVPNPTQPVTGEPVYFHNPLHLEPPTTDYYPAQTGSQDQGALPCNMSVPHQYNYQPDQLPLRNLVPTGHLNIQEQDSVLVRGYSEEPEPQPVRKRGFYQAFPEEHNDARLGESTVSHWTEKNIGERVKVILKIEGAYGLLYQHPLKAEREFKKLYSDKLGMLDMNGRLRLVTGLARALKNQKIYHKFKEAECIILSFRGNLPLAIPFGHFGLDFTLVRLWQEMGKYDLAETLLLAMPGKNPTELLLAMEGKHRTMTKAQAEDELSQKTKTYMALVRLWEEMGKNDWAEMLLLAMAGKNPTKLLLAMEGQHQTMTRAQAEAELCKPSGKFDIDLACHWEKMGKNGLSEKLLLAMSGKNNPTELLLAMEGKHRTMTKAQAEAKLCKPSGKVDIHLVRLWENMGKNNLANKLRGAGIYK